MKEEVFRVQKAAFERMVNRKVGDEEFERRLEKTRTALCFIWAICIAIGLVEGLGWPEPWFPPYSTILGWTVLAFTAFSLVRDWVKREGTFYRRETNVKQP
jgi:hypothetical protein